MIEQSLPSGLRSQFSELARRLRFLDLTMAVAAIVAACLASWVLLFVADRFFETPRFLRFLLQLPAWAAIGWGVWRYCRRWVWGTPSIRELSRIVQRRHRRLGDRLLGIVELAEGGHAVKGMSEGLRQAAIVGVASEVAGIDFGTAAPSRAPRKLVRIAAALAVLGVVLFIIAGPGAWNAALRLLWPVSELQRYTFVSVDSLPGRLVVARGEPFEMEFGVTPKSWWKPTSVAWRIGGGEMHAATLRRGRARFTVPALIEPSVLLVKAGDVRRKVRVEPLPRPELSDLRLEVQLPDYLELPSRTVALHGTQVRVVKGARVFVNARASRRLASAGIDGKPGAALNGETFRVGPIDATAASAAITWRDEHGLEPATPLRLHVEAIPDAAPTSRLRNLPGALAILVSETLPFQIESNDDFGVKTLGVGWRVASPESGESVVTDTKGAPDRVKLEGRYEFNPHLLGVPEDSIVEVRALAEDFLPGRGMVGDAVHRIHVLSPGAHAELVRAQLEEVLLRAEEVARRQEELLEKGLQLRGDPEKMKSAEGAAQLKAQASEQEKLGTEAKRLSEEAAKMLKEALKNSALNPKTLEEMTKAFEMLAQLGQMAMPSASSSLSKSASSPGESRSGPLDEALKKEQEILEQLRKMQEQAGKGLDQVQADGIVARLKALSEKYGEAGGKLAKRYPELAGMPRGELGEEPSQWLAWLSADVAEGRRNASGVERDISRLVARLPAKAYQLVAEEMERTQMDKSLGVLVELVDSNQSAMAWAETGAWSVRFAEWARHLASQSQSGEGQQGGGQGAKSNLEAILRLMRVREAEVMLREQVGVLDRRKDFHPGYSGEAFRFAEIQRELEGEVGNLTKGACPFQADILARASTAMGDAAGFLDQPQTGPQPQDAQADAIHLIDFLLQQACSGNKSGAGMPSAMLGSMMGGGVSPGQNAGKYEGGSRGKIEGEVAESGAGGDSTPDKAGGLDGLPMPSEFRDALEGYFSGVDKLGGAN